MPKKMKILISLIVIFLGLLLVRDFLIKSLIGSIASNVTGAPVRVGGLSLSVIRESVQISDLKIYNPKGFSRGILADIPKIGVDFDVKALFRGKIHLRQLDLGIKEVCMVKNEEGKLNVDSLKIAAEKSQGKEKSAPAKQLVMQIGLLNLGMGRVVSKDYSGKGRPVFKVYEVNLNKSYKNITSAQQLAALIISEPLKAAGIRGLKMYGVSMLTGVAALPVAAAFTFAAKDFARQDFDVSWDRAYAVSLEVIKTAGRLERENKGTGIISAEISQANVILHLKKVSEKTTQVTISARRFGLPQPQIAAGVMYRLSEKLK